MESADSESYGSPFFSLLTAAGIIRLKAGATDPRTGKEADLDAEFGLPQFLNSSFMMVCGMERAMIKSGFSFPAGGSLLCVAVKD